MELQQLHNYLLEKAYYYNNKDFIPNDPISIPHQFHIKQDIEIAAFFASILAWGRRKTIISNTQKIMQYMEFSPYQFIVQHQANDLKRFESFAHRTFNATDLLYTIAFLKHHYSNNSSLESAFLVSSNSNSSNENIEVNLVHFHNFFLVFLNSQAERKNTYPLH